MTTPSPSTDPMLRTALQAYRSGLHTFASSPSTFQILKSLPSSAQLSPPKTLYILDSSFNPPTLAHLRIAKTALLSDPISAPTPKRLLLLLATQNADKAPKPAAFEQRLVMMEIFASSILSEAAQQVEGLGVDIGVIKLPYFADKAKSIEDSGLYPDSTQQVHLLGYDTLTRLLATKYYPPMHTLQPLHPFLKKHRLLVTYRADDDWGTRDEQDEYLRDIEEGKRDGDGAKKEWVSEGRIGMVEGRKEGEEIISSTRVREAAKKGNREALEKLVTKGVGDWVLGESLYKDD
ncbi:Nucleotidylyl transferase [Stipitochalara longipes BDJ]|nr:Nucleotidylyl transferase [Stipitochalara longipes BDJ]